MGDKNTTCPDALFTDLICSFDIWKFIGLNDLVDLHWSRQEIVQWNTILKADA